MNQPGATSAVSPKTWPVTTSMSIAARPNTVPGEMSTVVTRATWLLAGRLPITTPTSAAGD